MKMLGVWILVALLTTDPLQARAKLDGMETTLKDTNISFKLALASDEEGEWRLRADDLLPVEENTILLLQVAGYFAAGDQLSRWRLIFLSSDGTALNEQGPVVRASLVGPPGDWNIGQSLVLRVPMGAAKAQAQVEGRGPGVGWWSWSGGKIPKKILRPLQDRCVDGSEISICLNAGRRRLSLSSPLGSTEIGLGGEHWKPAYELCLPPEDGTGPAWNGMWLLEGPDQRCGILTASGFSQGRSVLSLMGGTMSGGPEFSVGLAKDAHWILPFNEGLILGVQELAEIWPGHPLPMRAGHFISIPAFGQLRGSGTLSFKVGEPEESELRMEAQGERLGIGLAENFRNPKAAIQIDLQWQAEGGVAGWARALAKLRERPGLVFDDMSFPSLVAKERREQRKQQREALKALQQRLGGALNLHYFKRGAAWERDEEPLAVIRELAEAGIDRLLWSQAASPRAVETIKAQGWLAGRYENFQDLYPSDTPLSWVDKAGWPGQAVLQPNGTWRRGWPHREGGRTYHAGIRSSGEAYRHAQAVFKKRREAAGPDYNAVFYDTTTASSPLEDHAPAHPLSRSEDSRNKLALLALPSDQVRGSESGHNGALGTVHYFEGMLSPWPGRFEDAGYDLVTRKPATAAMLKYNLSARLRAPLFELAHHDRVVNYNYWGDAANRLPEHWRFRDLLSCLYGQPQLWVMDQALWTEQKAQAIKSYRTWSPVVRHLFGQKMTDWKVLDQAGDVQETHWEDGSVVRVDFGKDQIELKGPVKSAFSRN